MISTKQGEIWVVNLEPTIGYEIQKERPVLIIDDDCSALVQMRMVIPITSWQDKFCAYPWLVKITANAQNKLKNDSALNIQQTRYLSTLRFSTKIGIIDRALLEQAQINLIKLINPLFAKKLF